MAVIGEMEALISGDASGLIGAIGKAQGAISSFASMAGGVFSGILGANAFMGIIGSVNQFASSLFASASEFESYSSTINGLLAGIGDTAEETTDSVGGSTKKLASMLLEVKDELIKYQDRIKTLNEDIAYVMKGDNVVEAKKTMYDRLKSLDDSYVDKIKSMNAQIEESTQSLADRSASREQDKIDTLADMDASHQDDILTKNDKFQDELSKLHTKKAKEAATKKFNEEMKDEEDAYKRKYDLRKTQIERDNKQAEDADKKASDKKISTLQKELAEEKASYTEHRANLKAEGEKQVKEYEDQNAKKLENYKKELEAEERAHEISLLKRKEADEKAGAGGGKASQGKIPGFADEEDPFRATADSVKGTVDELMSFTDTSPFKDEDILSAAKSLLLIDANAQKIIPSLGNVASAGRMTMTELVSMSENVMIRGGRSLTQFAKTLGITKGDLIAAGAEFDAQGKVIDQGSFWAALEKLNNTRFSGAMQRESQTFNGSLNLMKNQMQGFYREFMGITNDGQIQKGGLFWYIKEAVQTTIKFLLDHKDQIINILKDVAKFLIGAGTAIVNTGKWFKDNQDIIVAVITGIGMAITLALIPAISFLTLTTIPAAIVAFGGILAVAAPFIIFGAVIAAVVFGIIKVIKNWDQIVKFAKEVFDKVKKTITDVLNDILKWLGDRANDFFNWGKNIGESFVKGLKEAFGKVKDTIVNALDSAKKFIMGKSPPAEGPFSQIDTWGFNVGNSWVVGFQDAISNIKIPDIQSPTSGMGGTKTYNVSNETTHSPNITQTNTFNVAGQANAQNLASYLSFQLEHLGVL